MLKRILICTVMAMIPGLATAVCGSVPSSYPVLAGSKLEVESNSTVNNGTTTRNINGGAKYSGSLDAINPSTGAVISASASFPSLDPATFPSTGSSNTSASTIAAGSYKDVDVANSTTTTFTGGTYYIKKLDVGKSATVNLAAGSYFIEDLDLGDGANIVVSPTGPVRIYINNKATLGKNTLINATGTVANLQVFLYPGADWVADKWVTFVGVVYAPDDKSKVEFDNDANIRGALVTAGEVKIGKDAKIVFSAADQAAVGGVSTCVAGAAPGSFNAFETSTGATAVVGVIKTKVAGTAFSLDVVAITSGAKASTFTNTVKVELLGNTSTSVALGVSNCPVSSTVLQTVTVAISNGRSTVAFTAVNDAWRNVRVRISYPTVSPSVTSCSTDNFAIRPDYLANPAATDLSSVSAGDVRSLANTGVTGGNVHKAGRPFQLTATASNTPGATTANYAGTPVPMLVGCVLPSTGCVLGGLVASSWTASSGVVKTLDATYSEVGAISMKLVDSSFSAVDAADGSTAAEMNIESAVFNVGRFVPDHFDLIPASAPVFRTFNDTTCPTRSFTYLGQPFGYVTLPQASITAKNMMGGTTLNYKGNLWKLVGTAGFSPVYSAPVGTPDGVLGTPTVTDMGSGTGQLVVGATETFFFTRTTPVMPFMADITLTLSIGDMAENAVTGNGTIDTLTPAVFPSIAFDSGNQIRFGRLVLSNAHGSEVLNLPVPAETQFWNGAGFTRNTVDFCTQLAAANVALSNWQRNLNVCETSVSLSGRFNAGRGNLRLSAPGINNTGSVDLTLNLAAAGAGNTCPVVTVTGADKTWLRSGPAFNQNPVARASFGLYRGNKPLIYIREMY